MADGDKIEEVKPNPLIEVTPEMIEAGAKVIESLAPYSLVGSDAESTAREVFIAMLSQA